MRTPPTMKTRQYWAAFALVLWAATAAAHVSLEPRAAPGGSAYKATLRITHGCNGSATTLVRVFVPEGFRGARPMPKPGWTLSAPKVALALPYDSHGRRVTEEVREISWRGGPLPDAWADEFAFVGQLPMQPGRLVFKVLQECESGRNEWFETAAPGGAAPARPAPMLEVLPVRDGGHRH